uniref:RRM domain-containing protein n=1 Tax=Eutreptiella gymnastica TaxID=73025 RepID=A0A7S1NUR0_9EUGL
MIDVEVKKHGKKRTGSADSSTAKDANPSATKKAKKIAKSLPVAELREVFLGRCPKTITEEHVTEYYSKHLKTDDGIKNIKWVRRYRDGSFKGCGFVEFRDPKLAQKALKLPPPTVDGQQLTVELNTPERNRKHGQHEREEREEHMTQKNGKKVTKRGRRAQDKQTDQEKGKPEKGKSLAIANDSRSSASTAPAKEISTPKSIIAKPAVPKVHSSPTASTEVRGKKHRKAGSVEAALSGYDLFLGKVPSSVTEDHVRAHYKSLGADSIHKIRWITDRNGQFRGAGFVTFATDEVRQRAVALGPPVVDGTPLTCNIANQAKPPKPKGVPTPTPPKAKVPKIRVGLNTEDEKGDS